MEWNVEEIRLIASEAKDFEQFKEYLYYDFDMEWEYLDFETKDELEIIYNSISKNNRRAEDFLPYPEGWYARRWEKTQIRDVRMRYSPKSVIMKCIICGNEFIDYLSNIENRQTCSNTCHGVYVTKYCVKQKDTDIERLTEKWLIDNEIKYVKQYVISEVGTIVDFFIPPNICLYCDGDYWHSFEEVKEKDARITNNLKKLNYKVIRLTGSEIHNDEFPEQLRKN